MKLNRNLLHDGPYHFNIFELNFIYYVERKICGRHNSLR